jgi:hypothetical protein
MSNATITMEPEPRNRREGQETTRVFWKPALPETQEPRIVPPPKGGAIPYLLAPHPWPRGQFVVDPEA